MVLLHSNGEDIYFLISSHAPTVPTLPTLSLLLLCATFIYFFPTLPIPPIPPTLPVPLLCTTILKNYCSAD